jgi:ribulose-5-phosphate 4-epimerase/fuculose-1-phosphate aldolase
MFACTIHFYRTVFGVPFAVPKGSIEIRSAHNEGRAIEAAKLRLARRHRLFAWTLIADTFDMACKNVSNEFSNVDRA